MNTAKVFKSGNSQAIRLPKEFRTTETEYEIKKVGSSIVLTPKLNSWEDFQESLSEFSEDIFLDGRQQPELESQERGSL